MCECVCACPHTRAQSVCISGTGTCFKIVKCLSVSLSQSVFLTLSFSLAFSFSLSLFLALSLSLFLALSLSLFLSFSFSLSLCLALSLSFFLAIFLSFFLSFSSLTLSFSLRYEAFPSASRGHASRVTNVVFSSDDLWLLTTGGSDCSVFQWRHLRPFYLRWWVSRYVAPRMSHVIRMNESCRTHE